MLIRIHTHTLPLSLHGQNNNTRINTLGKYPTSQDLKLPLTLLKKNTRACMRVYMAQLDDIGDRQSTAGEATRFDHGKTHRT